MFAYIEGAVKKSVGKLRNVLAFPEGDVKKMVASIEKCWHLLMELLKQCWQAQKCVGIPRRSC